MNRKKVYAQALYRCGSENQMVVAIEEMSELQKEITKFLRGKGSYGNLIEELGDVKIMLEQMQMIFGISDEEVELIMNAKAVRLLRRLQKGEK